MKDTATTAKGIPNSFDLIHLLTGFVWPIVVLIIVFYFRKEIKNLINRLTKVSVAGASAEAQQQQQQSIEQSELQNSSNVDKALGLYSDATIELFKNSVEDDSALGEIKEDGKRINHLIRYAMAIRIISFFDHVYYSIFGSQIIILQQINFRGVESKSSLKYFYDAAVAQFPKTYENYSYDNYLRFLTSIELIVIAEDERIRITYLGVDFLKYLTDNGKTFYKPN